jgi:hypothetical protein
MFHKIYWSSMEDTLKFRKHQIVFSFVFEWDYNLLLFKTYFHYFMKIAYNRINDNILNRKAVFFFFYNCRWVYLWNFSSSIWALIQKLLPRSMIPDAAFHEFPAKTLRKLPVSTRDSPGSARNSTQESGDRIRLPVLTGSCRFQAEPDKSGRRIRSPEYCFHEISWIPRNRPFPYWIVRLEYSKNFESRSTFI